MSKHGGFGHDFIPELPTPPEPGAVEQVTERIVAGLIEQGQKSASGIHFCLDALHIRQIVLAALSSSVPSGGQGAVLNLDNVRDVANGDEKVWVICGGLNQHNQPELMCRWCHILHTPHREGRIDHSPWCTQKTGLNVRVDDIARALHAVATSSESASAVVAPNALSVPSSGGSPDLRELVKKLEVYVEWNGPEHEDDCPGDDTCDCEYKPMNDGINEVHRFLSALSSSVSPKGEQ